jgi:trehalose 6-phosphate phosphatase
MSGPAQGPESVLPETLARRTADALARPDGRRRLVLAVDYDGTIAPIAPTPDLARGLPGAIEALRELSHVARVAVISGRGLDDLSRRVPLGRVDLVSEHGLRLRPSDGPVLPLAAPLDPDALAEVRAALPSLITGRPGWIVEDKGVSLAVHHRQVPADQVEPTLTQVRGLLEDAATRGGGRLQPGHALLELRPSGAEKGAGLAAIVARTRDGLARTTDEDDRTADVHVVMVGDDLTDESAFAVAAAEGGLGVLVATQPRPSAATTLLRDPSEVERFLMGLVTLLT